MRGWWDAPVWICRLAVIAQPPRACIMVLNYKSALAECNLSEYMLYCGLTKDLCNNPEILSMSLNEVISVYLDGEAYIQISR